MRLSSVFLALVLAGTVLASAEIYVVAPDGSGDFPTIQAAVDFASDGDVIELADGVFTGAGNRDVDFQGKAITLRSEAGGPELCVIDCQGSPGEPHRALRFDSGEGSGSIVSAITIENGHVEGDYPEHSGAAIFCFGYACPTIRDCVFRENHAPDGAGGALFARNSSPHVVDCEFLRNSAQFGGAVDCAYSASDIKGCIFQENHAGCGGALICCWPPGPRIRRCTFRANSAGQGDAVYW